MRTFVIGIALAALVLTAPAAFAQRGPGRGGMGGDGMMLLTQKSVQDELKLSDDQVKQLTEQFEKQRESFGDLRDLSREERMQKFTEMREQGQKAVASVLNEDQQKRYHQISLQLQGGQAFSSPEIASKLGLTEDQKKSITEIQADAREEMRGLFQGGDGDRDAMRKKFQEARQATNEKLQGVLTTEQKAKWAEMTGEPFKGELRGPSRGGPGGRRGNRDGAAFSPAADVPTVLTADRDDGEEAQGDEEDSKANKPAAKARKKHGKHHASKHGKHKRGSGHARHHRGRRSPMAMHARHGHSQRDLHHHARRQDPRAQAWDRVALAMGHEGPRRSFSHRGPRGPHGQLGHKGMHYRAHGFQGPPHHRHFAGRSHHGRRGPEVVAQWGHGHRGPHRGHPGYAHHQHHGPRPEFARRHHGHHSHEFAHHRHFAPAHSGRLGHPHGWHRGPRPNFGFEFAHHAARVPRHHAPRDQHSPMSHSRRARPEGPHFAHRGEFGRHHGPRMAMGSRHHEGPPAMHGMPHPPHHGRMHMTGFHRGPRAEHGGPHVKGHRDHGDRAPRDGHAGGDKARKGHGKGPAVDKPESAKDDAKPEDKEN